MGKIGSRRRRVRGSKIVYRGDSMMSALVAAGLRQWDHRWLYLHWFERAVCLAVAALFLSLTEHGIGNPTGGQVVSGTATITASPNTLQVDQQTKLVIIDWASFNIAAGETTRFNQPGADALAANRIGGNDPSQILGSLLANGRIVLINGNGIVFGPHARIDVGALIATTSDAGNEDIASGKAGFDQPGNPNAMIVTQGTIRADGMVGLVAPAVRNDGVIVAKLATLGASNRFTVDFTGDGLISFPLDANVVARAIDESGKPVEALVVNNGRIEGTTVLLSARAASNLVTNVISMGGTIAATSVHQDGGKVVLDAGDGGVSISGTITAVGRTGGSITVTGGNIALKGASLDASGTQGGGTIKVGGWTAGSAIADASTRLSASATADGNGGNISVIAANTQFAGQADARGSGGGNGGNVETSGHVLDIAGADIDTSAVAGAAGTWLLDPDDYTIDAAQAATIQSNLATGNVTIETTFAGSGGNGDIFVNVPVSWASANSLTLSAYRNININANVTVSGGGHLSLTTGTGTAGDYNIASGNSISFTGAPSSGASLSINSKSYTLLYSMSDVQNINAKWQTLQGNYALANSLDASAVSNWIPIGTDGAGNIPGSEIGFSGTFAGLGNTISNLVINLPSVRYVGLFGYSSGTIRDLGLIGGSVSGWFSVGGLVGSNSGTISNAYTTGAVMGGDYVGGLVGTNYMTYDNEYAERNSFGKIIDSYSTGTVSGGSGVGGLVGINGCSWHQQCDSMSIIQSYATGAVSGTGELVGGLVGENFASITQSYATGAVSGSNYVGGLVGWNSSAYSSAKYDDYSYRGDIYQSYATGAVSSTGKLVGGLVGSNYNTFDDGYSERNYSGSIGQSYWDTQTTGQSNGVGSGDASGATGLTSAQARTQSSYVGWDFAGDWFMIDGETRPFLRSEYSTTIVNAHQLQLMAMDLSATYTLANDIDMGPALAADANGNYSGMWGAKGFVPVGNDASRFTGTFDGEGHTINNLTINRPSTNYVGLFGALSGSVRDAGLVGGSVTGQYYVGQLAGRNDGTIEQFYTTGTVTGTGYVVGQEVGRVGGLVGLNDGDIALSNASGAVNGYAFVGGLVGENKGEITQSHATGAIDGLWSVGGLVGQNYDGTIAQSYATGSVSGSASGIGGLVGYAWHGTITQSYATGAVDSGNAYVGGLVGYSLDDTITQSYALGEVHGEYYVGGLVGIAFNGTIAQSYATGNVTGSGAYSAYGYHDYSGNYVGGLVGGNYDRIEDSYASGAVNGSAYVGGLAGKNSSTITNSHASGAVNGTDYVGGLVGEHTLFTITGSYATGSVSGNEYVGGLVGSNYSESTFIGSIAHSYATGTVDGVSVR